MTNDKTETFEKENFDIHNLEDEIRIEKLCREFLNTFYLHLLEQKKLQPEKASTLAFGADYFLREFIIPEYQENIFSISPKRVRQFAGNWYIIKNLKPNMAALENILEGVQFFYEYCEKNGKIDKKLAEKIEHECKKLDYYKKRMEDFWAIEDDGYLVWEKECGLKE